VAQGSPEVAFVDQTHRSQAQQAIDKGLNIILKTQVRVDGKLTVWCAQHDEVTLAPAKARSYELPSLSGKESVEIVRYLMDIDHPGPEIRQAINSACGWFSEVQITGLRLTRERNPAHGTQPNRTVVQDPDAPRLWARFYDISTSKPIYVDRDGIPRDSYNDLSAERRDNYSYLGDFAERLLSKDYPAWKEKW
jgi:PelA/Pel-15E family pectate lyase